MDSVDEVIADLRMQVAQVVAGERGWVNMTIVSHKLVRALGLRAVAKQKLGLLAMGKFTEGDPIP